MMRTKPILSERRSVTNNTNGNGAKQVEEGRHVMKWSMQRLLGELRRALAAPSRTPRTAVVIGRLLAIAFLLCFSTGLFSHFLQDPLPWMRFPTRPSWIYQVTQGVHITSGLLCFPLLFAKLYAVFPNLFQTPPVRSLPHLIERASIALFVASSLVQIAIGMLNTFQWYSLFPFPFRQTHYALSYVVIGSLAIHIAVKLPVIAQYWSKRSSAAVERVPVGEPVETSGSGTSGGRFRQAQSPVGEPVETSGSGTSEGRFRQAQSPVGPSTTGGVTGRIFAWIDATPEAPRQASRRSFFVTVAAAAGVLVVTTAGQSFRVFDVTNIFGPRKNGTGPQGLPVNRTAVAAKVTESAMAADWTLTVKSGSRTRVFSRAALEAMTQYEVTLPIACVEGWSQTAVWKGPRMRDLADAVGADHGVSFRATSLETNSSYGVMEMGPEYVRDDLTLVALQLDGKPLDIDHGYPARMIAPGRPGVLQTKWLTKLEAI
jgi:hypothetical protein